jgi:dUTP pyrophosphatase
VGTLIYVAVPIDGVGRTIDEPWGHVRDNIKAVVGNVPGVVGYYPSHAFTVGPHVTPNGGLERANRGALAACDGLVALLPAGVPSVGVPREIESAKAAGLPVAVVTDNARSYSLTDVMQFPVSIPGLRSATSYVRDEAQLRAGVGRLRHNEIAVYRTATGSPVVPSRAHATDAGYDLHTSREVTIEPGAFADVHTDLHVAMPPNLWGRIVGRSSTFRRRKLLVLEGVIDAGYRGPIYTGVTNLSDEPVTIATGERVAQFIPHVNVAARVGFTEVGRDEFDRLPHDGRGAAGFGSSGS